MSFLEIFNVIGSEAIRTITGRLFTEEQIRQVATHTVGQYFKDLLPMSTDDRAARQRVEEARSHIEQASLIISQLQSELCSQTQLLDNVLEEIEEKKRLASKYETLAKTGQEQFAAFKSEMETALRQELTTQSEKGRPARLAFSAFLWSITLILGAALGSYFREVLEWLSIVTA
ncbi:hypothetical protein [Alcaligenes endophyticus]|uniref:DUF1640 domain-containing protein n=1 Tax=Alcaligenes endophyticus TaxID=1929088 RepID=A0ABT8EJ15_9BURK|nr:hypothetical protein [Alcaligenes endophyticus]MCX5591606.1 hypothetical protein [Alcaligenes endophyticus]MDN4121283.1 hypothetical protein [Alcaligenes endophyticus]